MSSVLFVFGLYFIAWVAFPQSVASSTAWCWAGLWLILFNELLILYMAWLYVRYVARPAGKPARPSELRTGALRDADLTTALNPHS